MTDVRASRNGWRTLFLVLAVTSVSVLSAGAVASDADGAGNAIALSQSVIGGQVPALAFEDAQGGHHRLSDFYGRPVLVSLIFTGCVHSCSVTTRHLDRMVRVARNALGDDSFTVLTIGFDHPVDSPQAMQVYARRHAINDPAWHFLSSPDAETVDELTRSLGFYSVPSPRGFDHTVQVTLLDESGKVYRQVYGETFSTPLLVEPLKDLVLGRPRADAGLVERVGNRIRLFCTAYDPKADRYYFDYSLFVGIFIGIFVLGTVAFWLLAELRKQHRAAPG
jgi:protein SCO1